MLIRDESCNIGSDIEVFGLDGNDKLILPKKTDTHQDGLCFEFQTNVGSCRDNLSHSIQCQLKKIQELYGIQRVLPRYSLPIPKDAQKWALRVGCSESINGYNGKERPKDMEKENYRTTGGHIHIDYNHMVLTPYSLRRRVYNIKEHEPEDYFTNIVEKMKEVLNKNLAFYAKYTDKNAFFVNQIQTTNLLLKHLDKLETAATLEKVNLLVKLYDRTAGLLSVVSELFPEDARMRRRYYGRAGSYRLKKYGVEYRVMSSNDMLIPHIRYTATRMMRTINTLMRHSQYKNFDNDAFKLFNSDKNMYMDSVRAIDEIYNVASDMEIQMIINECLQEPALELFKKVVGIFEKYTTIFPEDQIKTLFHLCSTIANVQGKINEKNLGLSMMSQQYMYGGLYQISRSEKDLEWYESYYFSKE